MNSYLFSLIILCLGCICEVQAQTMLDSNFLSAFEYRHVGPTRGGRVTTVAGIASKPETFYLGATGGGVWKTEDYGINWKNVSDGYFTTPSIGDIQIAPSNPNIVYVGTGSDGIRSNIIAGKGVYKSENGGKSWKHIGLEKVGQIGAVEVHPENPDIVFVAAIGQAFNANPERGVYRSLDGGQKWEQVFFHSDTVGVVDLEFHPNDPSIIYASLWRVERKPWTIISGGYQSGGIYKSINNGKDWKKLTKGLPDGIIGKIDLAVSAADPDRLYALVEAPEDTKEGGLYRSDNQGKNFELVSNKKELLDRPFYYCNIEADPNNADIIYSLATGFYKSTDGGKKWNRLRVPHGDNHDMWINPTNSDLFIQCNDGGANVTLNGGKSWSSQHNQGTAELYQVEVDDQYPYWLYAGQQDNSTISVPSHLPSGLTRGASDFWMAVGGCETGPAVPKPGNPNIVYSNCKGRFGVYNKLTGQEQQFYVGAANMYGHNPKDLKYRFQRVAPIHVSIHNPDIVYHGSQFLHKTTDDGHTWETISPDLTAFDPDKQVISGSPITRDITGEEFYSTIYSIRESPIKEGVIWIGANDGPVHLTQDGGKSWENVTPKMPLGGRVDAVEPSPHQLGKAYVSVLRYQLGDWKPYIYKTEDFGKNWELLTNGENGIPNAYPVRVMREDPDREGLLYAGTEYGLFISIDDGQNWQSFQQNLPVTPITDIKVHRKDLVLSTMGRGFWIMDNLSPLHQAKTTSSSVSLFEIEDTHHTYRKQRTRSNESGVSYPSPSATIDYYLPKEVKDRIQIEILNTNGQVIRAFSSKREQAKEKEEQEPDMATGFFTQGSRATLAQTAGLHRLKWDMRHLGPWDKSNSASGRNGPLVAPGTYQVRLHIEGKVIEQTFEIKADPRLKEAGITQEDLIAQERLSLNIRDLYSDAKKLGEKIKERLKEIEKELEEQKRKKRLLTEKETLLTLEGQLFTKEGRYHQPMLISQIGYLSSMLNRADQRPGKDAYDRYEALKSQLKAIQPEVLDVLGEDDSAGDEE